MASRYYKTQGDPEMADVYAKEYADRISKIINILAPSSQQPITPTPLRMSGWGY